MQMLVNTQAVITIRLFSFKASQCLSRSRSVILTLNVGDQLYVTITNVGCFYADSQRVQLFSGFRLF